MEIYTIRGPEDTAGLAWFTQVAAEIYRVDPVWVPQSEGYFLQTLAAAQVSGAHVIPVVCLEDGRPLARAAAILNPAAPTLGYIGFFEHHPGAQAAGRQVLETCENLLRAWGAVTVQAPRVDNLWMGLQVSGFELPQTIFTAHNLPEYEQTLLSCAYREVERLYTYRFTRASAHIPVFQLPGVRTRTFDRRQLDSEVRMWNELQTKIFSGHAGYVPRSLEEDRAMIRATLPLLDDELVIVAENDLGQAVGLLVCLPDSYAKEKPATSARLISIGVLPGWKYKGSGALMVKHLVRNLLDKGCQSLEASLIKADNRLPHNLALRFGGVPGREFAVFEKKL